MRFTFILSVLFALIATQSLAAKTNFVDGNPKTRQPGTILTADYLNAVNNHRHDGKSVDGSGVLDFQVATGSANALAITLSPAINSHILGMPIYIMAAQANTGAATLTVNGLTPAAITKRGQPLAANDLAAGQIVSVAWDGSSYQLVAHEPLQQTDIATVSGQTAGMLSPPGQIMAYASTACPSGWLAANGQAVDRTTYAELYTAISTLWGPGDGITTFNVPDLRGEFLRGYDAGRGIDNGRSFASAQPDQFQSHNHKVYASPTTTTVPSSGNPPAPGNTTVYDSTFVRADHLTDIYAAEELEAGTNGTPRVGAETRPRNIAVLYCVKY